MFKNILDSVIGFDTWSIVTMILFFVFFIALIFYVLSLDKKFINKMSQMPFDDKEEKIIKGDE